MTPRKILAVTGARSEYDILFPVLQAMRASGQFDVGVVATGAHLSPKFGRTVQHIYADGFRVADTLHTLLDSDDKSARAMGLGQQIVLLSHCLQREKPDLVLVVGDREEALATAIAGAYAYIPVVHLAGGDMAQDGNVDNAVRYATSKLAHLHLVFHPLHAKLLERLGEEPWRIHHVGNPALDRLLSEPRLERQQLAEVLNFGGVVSPYLVLIHHPIPAEHHQLSEKMRCVLNTLRQFGMPVAINSPNSDAGHQPILDVFSEFAHEPLFYFFQNLPRLHYVNLLRHAQALVGNSSSGLLEAPSFGLPTLNIGVRQRGRLAEANVQFVEYDPEQIDRALRKACFDEAYRQELKAAANPYGDGHSGERIARLLANLPLDESLTHKKITYEWNALQ